jgi:hypothetical protein
VDLILWDTNDNELAAGTKTGHKRAHRTADGSRGQNRHGSAHSSQHGCGIIDSGIYIDKRAQILLTPNGISAGIAA